MKTGVILSIILLITFFSFSPSLNNDFTNWDDPKYLTDNNLIKDLSVKNIKSIFFDKELKGRSYVPVTLVTFAIEHHFYQLDPKIYHFNNLLLHLLNTALVFWLILLISQKTDVSVITAVLFGIHPLHVESVAWLTERKDVLFSFFYLSALVSYVMYCKRSGRKGMHYIISLLLFMLSLLSKGMAVTLPVILLLIDYLLNKRANARNILEKVPFFMLSVAWGIITILVAKSTKSIAGTEAFSFFERTLFAFYGIVHYLYKLIVPADLSCFYPYPNLVDGRMPVIFYLAPVIVLLFAFIVYKSVKHTKVVLFGSLFFLSAIALVLQFFPVGPNIVTDRYTYLPYIGLFFILGKGYSYIQNQEGKKYFIVKKILIVVLIGYAGILSYLCHERCKVWKNSLTLWTDMISQFPNQSEGYLNRGQYYTDIGEHDKALPDYNTVIAIKPNSVLAYVNRGNVYGKRGEYENALNDYSKAISLDPYFSKNYLNRGNVYGMQGKHDLAIADFTNAISLEYNYLDAYVNRAISYSQKRDFDKAFDDFNKALEINPNSVAVYTMRAYACLDKGDFDKSIADYNKLLSFNSRDANSYFYRGLAYQKKGDYNAAINDYNMCLRINPALGAAYMNRSLSYDAINDYAMALQDVFAAQKSGQNISSDYIERLKNLSGKGK